MVGRPAADRRRRRLHLQLHRQEPHDEHGDHDHRHHRCQGSRPADGADLLLTAEGRHGVPLPADPAQARVGESHAPGGAVELRQSAAGRGHRTIHHDRIQARRLRRDEAQPELLGHTADHRPDPVRSLHQRRHHGLRPEGRHHRRRLGRLTGPVRLDQVDRGDRGGRLQLLQLGLSQLQLLLGQVTRQPGAEGLALPQRPELRRRSPGVVPQRLPEHVGARHDDPATRHLDRSGLPLAATGRPGLHLRPGQG